MAKQVPLIVINGLLVLLLFYYASIQVPVAGLVIGALMPLPTILTIRRVGYVAGLLLVTAGVFRVDPQQLLEGHTHAAGARFCQRCLVARCSTARLGTSPAGVA